MLGDEHAIMKTILILLVAAILAGCASQAPIAAHKSDVGGLTKAQWQEYDKKAADAAADPAAWRKIGAHMPKGIQVASRSPLATSSNSPDDIRPPTKVNIAVPIKFLADNSNAVVVEFAHPAGKITAMYATGVNVD